MHLKLIIFGFMLHIVLFYSIFDIYFTSPIIHGVPHHSNPLPPPAKRLVLFSADGLRADKLFEIHPDNISYTPFLRSIAAEKGVWGISHTRVPTESRPGHVAMIAGFYEDVSAITKGWKENPVEFDSVFNQSSGTLAWGSPDILPMFAKGSTGDHVITHTYPGENEDFAGSDLTKLDTWVFENVEEYLEKVSSNSTLRHNLKSITGLIFFLHLLGLDTTGHVHKPYSYKYEKNLKVVDKGVKRVVELMEEFFEDDASTAYIFTSDHGMTDWGSHGAGDSSETETPLVAWGAGVATDAGRKDLQQADICVLMSTLLGLPISLQSVGIVPVQLLSADEEFKAHSVLTNAKQLYEQYKAKMLEKRACTLPWLFSPYKQHGLIEQEMLRMEAMLASKEFHSVTSAGRHLMQNILHGFRYYHNYERTQLGLCVCLSYVAWMLYIGTLLLQQNRQGMTISDNQPFSLKRTHKHDSDPILQQQHSNFQQRNLTSPQHFLQPQQQPPHQSLRLDRRLQHKLNYFFSSLALVIVLALYVESRPLMHYVYFLTPLFLWYLVFSRGRVLGEVWQEVRRGQRVLVLFVVAIVACLEIMIFSFMYRQLMTLVLLSMAVWAFVTNHKFFAYCCLVSSIYPLLPTVGKTSNYYLVYTSCLVAFVYFSVAIWRSYRSLRGIPGTFLLQLLLIPFSGFLVWWFESERSSYSSSPSPLYFNMHIFSWCILGLSFILPLFSPTKLPLRILSLSISFFCPHLLLSIAHESFFYVALCALLYSWLLLETGKSEERLMEESFRGREGRLGETSVERGERRLGREDIRRVCFYLFFLLLSFFGTGNIASINSFDPTSILPFISVFNPFIMGALCLFKILVLLQLVSCYFQAIQVSINLPPHTFFFLLLIISDFMACHFFFMVRDSGSWLDIGTSISHYVIIMSFIIFFFVFLTLSKLLTHTSLDLKRFSEKKSSLLKWFESLKNNHVTHKYK